MSMFADYMHHRDNIVFYKLLTRDVDPRLIAKAFAKPIWFVESISSMPKHVHDNGFFNKKVATMYDPLGFIYDEHMRGLSKDEIAVNCLNHKILGDCDLEGNSYAFMIINMIINYINCERKIYVQAIEILAFHDVPAEDIIHAYSSLVSQH